MITIETERLRLRQWEEKDKDELFKMNSDGEVMRYFPSVYTREQSDLLFEKVKSLIQQNGWGFWVCETKLADEFVGFVGLNKTDSYFPFPPAVEIGWRLLKEHWKKGYATEAVKACLDYAFNVLNADEVVSFAVRSNKPSIAVMERIGMSDTFNNFDHPKVKENHLREHVLYRIKSTDHQA